ncbi:hypothetical protein LZ009_23285 [Ramlibacter sp. XY19]|uniref:hypothetical protein n=1 Tax=Ramlibacter paludis TaxID=2908000 RepID=UPI0023DB89E9|nr:hypothetical protein [Ramlibacter paludis]MCG2595712.1 hypothetical protein [Ramlibacter paludis]
MKRVSAWVFWLALLLPLAQLGAAVHGYAHLQDPTRSSSDKHLLASCDVCVAAAVIGAGAAPAATHAALPLPAVEHDAPRDVAHVAPALVAAAPYQSRAPPSLPA